MADRYQDLLRPNWKQVTADKRGTVIQTYVNEKTGQVFYSKKDFERYMAYIEKNEDQLCGSMVVNDPMKEGEEPNDTLELEKVDLKQKGVQCGPDVHATKPAAHKKRKKKKRSKTVHRSRGEGSTKPVLLAPESTGAPDMHDKQEPSNVPSNVTPEIPGAPDMHDTPEPPYVA